MQLTGGTRCVDAKSFEKSLMRQEVERDVLLSPRGRLVRGDVCGPRAGDVQLDPELHARALTHCIDGLPIDGVYVNLCFSREQASGRNCAAADTACRWTNAWNWSSAGTTWRRSRERTSSRWMTRASAGRVIPSRHAQTFQAMPPETLDRAAVCVG